LNTGSHNFVLCASSAPPASRLSESVLLLLLLQVVNERLSPNCWARLTVENDDKASQYSVTDLMLVHQLTGMRIMNLIPQDTQQLRGYFQTNTCLSGDRSVPAEVVQHC
jgi:hypothetical protein